MIRFDLDRTGVQRLLSAPEADRVLTNVAEGIARDWRRLDPRRNPPNIDVASPDRLNGVGAVSVFTDDSIWHLIEFGSVNNPPYRPITKAVQNAGLHFEDAG